MKSSERAFAGVVAALGWAALAIQLDRAFYAESAQGASVTEILVRFFSFFTILTNLLIAAILTVSVFRPGSAGPLDRTSVRSAAVVYILVVGCVYEVFLRRLTDPQGWGFVSDMVLHDVVPIAYVVFWIIYVRRGDLRWRAPVWWLIYPAAYFVYTLLRGLLVGRYPYFFVDVRQYGYGRVLTNAVVLLAGFLMVGLALVAIDRAAKRLVSRSI